MIYQKEKMKKGKINEIVVTLSTGKNILVYYMMPDEHNIGTTIHKHIMEWIKTTKRPTSHFLAAYLNKVYKQKLIFSYKETKLMSIND